jgi:uncharacterized protein YndB with AHSA1/START domain
VPTARRSRTIGAAPERVWETVGDPHHLPRWWPRVQRVEGVRRDRFTEVLQTKSGRLLRADFRVVESRAPARRVWEQQLEGSPFERVFRTSRTEVALEPDAAGTLVTIVVALRLRGPGRFGGWVVRRATGRLLDDALGALEALHGA